VGTQDIPAMLVVGDNATDSHYKPNIRHFIISDGIHQFRVTLRSHVDLQHGNFLVKKKGSDNKCLQLMFGKQATS